MIDRWTDEDKWWMLLKGRDGCELLLWIFGKTGTIKPDMQEYICRHRPDLIGEIENLDPELARKYSYEVELSNTDL